MLLAHAAFSRPRRFCASRAGFGTGTGNHHRQIVIRIHDQRCATYSAVPVMIGIATPGDVDSRSFSAIKLRHRVGRRAIHANLPIPIHGHEPERLVHIGMFTYVQVQACTFSADRVPNRQRLRPPRADLRHSFNFARRQQTEKSITSSSAVHIFGHIIMLMRRGSGFRATLVHDDPLHAAYQASPRFEICSFARSSIHFVAEVSAGPPDSVGCT